MSIEESITFKRGWRILLLHKWAKATGTKDFDEIYTQALLKFVCTPGTAKAYAREVLLRMERERADNENYN